MLRNILRTTECGNLTPLSILVEDDNRISINIGYTHYYKI